MTSKFSDLALERDLRTSAQATGDSQHISLGTNIGTTINKRRKGRAMWRRPEISEACANDLARSSVSARVATSHQKCAVSAENDCLLFET
eukprot:CAMPEP_0204551838 /NCGR_PEP_ID=MMETSP0661-20131031/26200_1 /ASSEMBLY_ACC=CAM_ASM_000606 /TAXON_ID=109239 /ORGANISM="Alexandrium margalefi, Strain AMGDE01CS-322" /LENGTH=89 /DNA_ID=CAMNT_0051558833 /DNA_START=25 /DNA_END=291 /DNA_ORIENTATION=-